MICYYGIKNDGVVNVTSSSTKRFKDLPVLSCKSCDEFWAEMQKFPPVKIQTMDFMNQVKERIEVLTKDYKK